MSQRCVHKVPGDSVEDFTLERRTEVNTIVICHCMSQFSSEKLPDGSADSHLSHAVREFSVAYSEP